MLKAEEKGAERLPAGTAGLWRLEQWGGHCLMARHVPLSSQGTWHVCITGPLSPASPAMNAKNRHGAKGTFHPSLLRQGNSSSAGSWQLRGLPSYWTMFCVPERGDVAEIINLSSFWMKERIL